MEREDAAARRGLSRRDFLLGVGAAAVAGGRARAEDAKPSRPNVVLVMADDLGAECLGSYGGSSYATPHLDALAASGLRFTNAFATPLCTPSRVQALSGQYPFRNGWEDGIWKRPAGQQFVPPKLFALSRGFRSAGYATAVAGKWQLADLRSHPEHPAEAGFDEHCLWMWRYRYFGFEEAATQRYWKPAIVQNDEPLWSAHRDEVFGPDVFHRFLVDFTRRSRERPFFAFYPMVLPHRPFVEVPGTTPDRSVPRSDYQARFAQMLSYLDGLVGKLVASLDERGLRDNTLLLFTSDNGTDVRIRSRVGDLEVPGGKGSMKDAGSRVPLIASWPGVVPRGAVCDDLTDSTDLLPTLMELNGHGLAGRRRIDGRSLAPQLRGEAGDPRAWVHIQHGAQRAVRTRGWKLMSDGRLYDLTRDPEEKAAITRDTAEPDQRRVLELLAKTLEELEGPSVG